MVKLQDMIFEIKYIEGDKNILADLLSRPGDLTKSTLPELHEVLISHAIIREGAIRHAQTPEFIESCGIKEEGLVIKDGLYYITRDGATQLLLPPKFRQDIIRTTHAFLHFGRKKTLDAIRKLYFWPGMYTSVLDYVRHWDQCQWNKRTNNKQVDSFFQDKQIQDRSCRFGRSTTSVN